MVDKAIAFCFTDTVIYRAEFKYFFELTKTTSLWYFQINRITTFPSKKKNCARRRVCSKADVFSTN